MPSIRDLVLAISRREGVTAAVVLGRDGLLIDSQVAAGADAEDLAARIPAIVNAAHQLGQASGGGDLVTILLEYGAGVALVCLPSDEAVLLVMLSSPASSGEIVAEIRRNLTHIAALV